MAVDTLSLKNRLSRILCGLTITIVHHVFIISIRSSMNRLTMPHATKCEKFEHCLSGDFRNIFGIKTFSLNFFHECFLVHNFVHCPNAR